MLRINIVSPERPFFDEQCYSVTVPGKVGEMQILPGHAALLAELKPGLLSIAKSNHEEDRFMVSEGFIEVDHDQVTILCEQARFKSEIDKGQEEALLKEIQEKIVKAMEDDAEQKHLVVALSRCMARLSLLE
jgi:F-type H+-transporting ATPase subunit epsilon